MSTSPTEPKPAEAKHSAAAKEHHLPLKWRLAFVFVGIGMVLLCFVAAMVVPKMDGARYEMLRVVMALGGAFAAGGISGLVRTDIKFANMAVQGTAGFAVFLVLFYSQVSGVVAAQSLPEENRDAAAALEEAVKQPATGTVPGTAPARRLSLDAVAKQNGYDSFLKMKVTASPEKLRAITMEVKRPR